MTTNEQAARIANIAREITAAMEAFPRLNRKQQTNLAIGGDLLIERLHVAWAQFVGDQWKESYHPLTVKEWPKERWG